MRPAGFHHTEETKIKLSETSSHYWLGKKHSEEHRQKFNFSGHKHTEKAKQLKPIKKRFRWR